MSDIHEKAKRILLVDDDKNTRFVLTQLLGGMGYVVFEAKDAEEAMKWVEIGPIDLVMTDLRMPTIDGIELTRAIRRTKPKLPVVVYSGNRYIDTARVALKVGANEYIAKPFMDVKIRQVIERLLKEQE